MHSFKENKVKKSSKSHFFTYNNILCFFLLEKKDIFFKIYLKQCIRSFINKKKSHLNKNSFKYSLFKKCRLSHYFAHLHVNSMILGTQ